MYRLRIPLGTSLVYAALFFGSVISAAERQYDLIVVGGTPGGIACAVRAAREGLSVLLVNRHDHLGGMLSSGLGVWDTRWEGKRSPIYDELREAILEHYRTTYGVDSPQYRDARPGATGHTNGRYEPHVAERLIDAMVARETKISVVRGYVPTQVRRDQAKITAVEFRELRGPQTFEATAKVFADCTYEGDLMALSKTQYRAGREARSEYDEPHAGVIFMRATLEPPSAAASQLAALHAKLKLRPFAGYQELLPASTGAASDVVQACNYRMMLTSDPKNAVAIPPSEKQDPYFLKSLEVYSGVESVPNEKFSWNRPQLLGWQSAYIEADWQKRQQIMDEHWATTLALLYFLQHDGSIPRKVRDGWLQYGLAKDEFVDNGHRPYEMYIRETRRLVGRYVFTEHDAVLSQDFSHTPVHADSIAMTEWYLDTHGCTIDRVPDSLDEGKMMLHQETFPGQIPYRCLLPKDVDNLLVPVCLSATHVAWGTVRLEPVWMQTGESAGFAAAMAVQDDVAPAKIDTNRLVRRLAEQRSMISFFNDVDVSSDESWIAAAEYFGTKGFFADYDVRPTEPLKAMTAKVWADGFDQLVAGKLDPVALMQAVASAERSESSTASESRAAALVRMFNQLPRKAN